MDDSSQHLRARDACLAALISSYAFVFYEWVFQYTKPSFLDSYHTFQVLSIPFVVPLLVVPLACTTVVPLLIFSAIKDRRSIPVSVTWIALLSPALISAATLLLVIDNFTYTVLTTNIGNLRGAARIGFALFVILLVASLVQRWMIWATSPFLRDRLVVRLALGLLVVSTATAWFAERPYNPPPIVSDPAPSASFPDIIILSTDGLDASHLSIYGYNRDTTPFISNLSRESAVFQNAFPNCSYTTGAVGSLFTGKVPTRTHMVYPPDVFTGDAVFQSLPRILRNLGYRAGDVSIRHYADPYDRGLREAFDYANGRAVQARWAPVKFLANRFPVHFIFLEHLLESVMDRVSHVFGIREYFNAYLAVVGVRGVRWYTPVAEDMRLAMSFLESSGERPVFLHVHLLGTHGPYFYPRQRHFSAGEAQTEPWMTDFLDDALGDFDGFCERVADWMKQRGRFDNSVFVITSDHGSRWKDHSRIPLIIRFPHGEHRGSRNANVQTIDLPPTVLSVLHQQVPDWMEGQSLINSKPSKMRPILSARPKEDRPMFHFWRSVAKYTPPFYSLGGISAVIGNCWYHLDVETGQIDTGRVLDHTADLMDEEYPSPGQVRQMLVRHLQSCGYDVSSLMSDVQSQK